MTQQAEGDLNGEVSQLFRTVTRLHKVWSLSLLDLEHPLTPRQCRLLERIREGYSTQVELARLMRLSAPSVSGSVDPLVRDGLIRRVRSENDGRAVELSLTLKGEKALRDAVIRSQDLTNYLRDQISDSGAVSDELWSAIYSAAGTLLDDRTDGRGATTLSDAQA